MSLRDSVHILNLTGATGAGLDCGPVNCSFPQGTCVGGVCQCEVRRERKRERENNDYLLGTIKVIFFNLHIILYMY